MPLMMQEVLPDYRSVTAAYFSAMTALGMRLLRLLALALGLPPEHFHPMFTRPMLFLRPLHYAPRRSLPEKVHILGFCSMRQSAERQLWKEQAVCSEGQLWA